MTWEAMFNKTTYIGTCKPIGQTWATIGTYTNNTTPTTFCNNGIYPSDATNDVSQVAFGGKQPTDSIVYTQNVITSATNTSGSYSTWKTQCYYAKDEAATAGTSCDTIYRVNQAPFGFSATQFCPCDLPCQFAPTSRPSLKPTRRPTTIKPTTIPTFIQTNPTVKPTSKPSL